MNFVDILAGCVVSHELRGHECVFSKCQDAICRELKFDLSRSMLIEMLIDEDKARRQHER